MRSERAKLPTLSCATPQPTARWNEGLRIEEALGAKALPFPARKLFRRALAER